MLFPFRVVAASQRLSVRHKRSPRPRASLFREQRSEGTGGRARLDRRGEPSRLPAGAAFHHPLIFGLYAATVMVAHTLDRLIGFCARQIRTFDPLAWRESESADRRTVAVAAAYLSMTSWYGYEAALEQFAEERCPGICSAERFHREAFAVGFDLTYFSAAVRYQVAVNDRNMHMTGRRTNLSLVSSQARSEVSVQM